MIAKVMDALVKGLKEAGIEVTSSDNDNDSGEIYVVLPAPEEHRSYEPGDPVEFIIKVRED